MIILDWTTFGVPLISKNGTIFFRIQATDETVITSESEIFVFDYFNANPDTDSIVPQTFIFSIDPVNVLIVF